MNPIVLLAALLIDVGNPNFRDHLGYGWSLNEHSDGRTAAWLNRMEADVFFKIAKPADHQLEIETKIFQVKDKVQNVGIYMNGKFVGSQLCKPTNDYQTLTYTVNAEHFIKGRNRMIIRVGHRARPKGDGRKLSLFVDKIRLIEIK